MDQNDLLILMDVVIAAILGGLLGLEREELAKPAGVRTNMIIASVSAFLVAIGRLMVVDYDDFVGQEVLRADPIRTLQAIIMGVSVLGAGVIMRTQHHEIKNLTTSATVLMASAIGMAVAMKHYILAVGVTILVLIINRVVRWVERKYLR